MPAVSVTFPGGSVVTAHANGFSIPTDQPVDNGGDNSAPGPYLLFLSSIATCAGFFVLRFCQERQLPTDQLGVTLDIERDADTRRLDKIKLAIQLAPDFPAKYRKAVIRAAEMCAVKKALMDPPEFEIVTE